MYFQSTVCNTFFTSSLSTACSNAQICSFVITNKIPFQKLVHLYGFRVFILLKLLSVAHGQHYITLSIIAYYYKVGAGFLLLFTNTSSSTLLYSQKKNFNICIVIITSSVFFLIIKNMVIITSLALSLHSKMTERLRYLHRLRHYRFVSIIFPYERGSWLHYFH